MNETKNEVLAEDERSVLASANVLNLYDPVVHTNHSNYDLAREFWVRSHPAMRKANDVVARAQHEANLIAGMLVETFEEGSTLKVEPGPHEGMTAEEVVAAEEAAKKARAESLAELRNAIKAYGVPVPQRAEKK